MDSGEKTTEQRGLIVNLAPVGVIPSKKMTPHVPVLHNEIVDTVASCIERGVQMVHLHTRDDNGVSSSDPERFGRIIEDIRALPSGRELVICVTTSGRLDPGFEARSRVLDLSGDMKPDMASLTLSSLNFLKSASVNEPEVIRKLAKKMMDRGIKPELEIFDLGMANFAHVLAKEGLINAPAYANLLFGNIAGVQTSLSQVGALAAALPAEWIICFAGIGRFQLQANILGVLYASGVRVGLEDNIFFDSDRRKLATNLELVDRVIRISEEYERPLMPLSQARELILGVS